MCNEALVKIKVLVEGQVSHTPDAKNFAIALNASKTFLAHIMAKNLWKFLQSEKFDKVMDKFQPLCFPNIQNLIASF